MPEDAPPPPPPPPPAAAAADAADASPPPSTCFSCTRLNFSTFLIVEDDQWSEQPFIYAKMYDSVLVLVDTGCGGASRDASVQLRSLRHFLETYPVLDNDRRPLNPAGEKAYVVLCTHCHYDHIGAIAQFTDRDKSAIWASANDQSFILDDLPTTSLCRYVGMKTPEYQVTNWAADGEHVRYQDHDLGLVIHHTPGHTPDELAIWDPQERFLFVGDTMYEWAPIFFPLEGDLRKYTSTLYKLRDLVQAWNGDENASRVKMACGHVTSAVDAADFVYEVDSFLSKVRRGLVESVDKGEAMGHRLVGYERDDGRISFLGPKALFDDFSASSCPL